MLCTSASQSLLIHNNSKPSPRGENIPRGLSVPVKDPRTSPRGNTAAGTPEGPPLLAPPPKSLLPPRPPLRSRRGRVSQPCPRPACGRRRAVSPVIWTARPGSAWHSMTVRRSIDPGPFRSQPRRLVLASASGTEAGYPEAAHPGGGRQGQAPPGTSSARPPFALRGAETTENEGRLLSPMVTVLQLRSSFIRCRRPSSSRRRRRRRCCRSRLCTLRLLSADRCRLRPSLIFLLFGTIIVPIIICRPS